MIKLSEEQLERLADLIVEKLASSNKEEQEWCSVKEVARKFAVTQKTVRVHWIGTGKLQADKTRTGRLRVRTEELLRFANETGRTLST